ncbi:MAG: carboxyl transferase domain-containing protein [Dehalococcoidales bacterium]|nr:carboxyl transferase domain-containing protein [Dehalococcoidales bacterium]
MSEDTEIKQRQLAGLQERRSKILEMGGAERVEAQKKRGKLTARERIDQLLDKGSFHEVGMFAKSRNTSYGDVPADGVITGWGKIDGRKVYIFSQDFTSMGGTLSETHGRKISNILDSAMKVGCPIIGLNDSGGARIQDGVDSLSGYGEIFYRNVMASGVVPQICAILGPTAGGGVYSPALMDFIFMVKGISNAFITGPRVVKAIMGQEVSEEELGGAVVAQKKSGVVCRSENSEVDCFQAIRELLSYLPSNFREKPKQIPGGDDKNRTDPTLFNIVPGNPSAAYDMHKIIDRVFDQCPDDKKNYFELFPLFATNIITCFSRLNGWPVGIIANQPMSKAGCLDIDASDKASRFIRFCDAFNVPIINLVDIPGYLPGTAQEWGGIIRHGAKMLYAYSEATVPKITLTVRKAYGGSYIGMCSQDLGADVVFCWPSTELAVMGAEGAAPIIFRREIEKAENPGEMLKQKIREYREEFANPYRAAMNLHIDDVIDPAETRPKLIAALEMMLDKTEQRPAKKHGVMPT